MCVLNSFFSRPRNFLYGRTVQVKYLSRTCLLSKYPPPRSLLRLTRECITGKQDAGCRWNLPWDTLRVANKQRSIGSTLLNNASSRSHAILTLDIKLIHLTEPRGVIFLLESHLLCVHSVITVLSGKINLVDLAGSENNKVLNAYIILSLRTYWLNYSISWLVITIPLGWPSPRQSINHWAFLVK